MTKKERIAVAVTGVVLFCVAAVFSISIFLGALDFGFSSGRNVLVLLGRMLFSVYGFCSVLIPVFFFVAGAFCLSANWSVQRAFVLLISVIPFFTLVLAERTSFSIAAQEANPVATVKIISLVAIALLLVALEYLVTITVAGIVEKALEQNFSLKEFCKDLKTNVKNTLLQTLHLEKTKGESEESEDEALSAKEQPPAQSAPLATPAQSAKQSAGQTSEHAASLDWSVDSEGNVKGEAAHKQQLPTAAEMSKYGVTTTPRGNGGGDSGDEGDANDGGNAIDEFEKESMDLTVQISKNTASALQRDFEIYDDSKGIKSQTPGDDERFFEDDEFFDDDFDAEDEDIEEIDDDFENQEYLSAIDETEIQEIDTPQPANDDFEFYESFQQEPSDEMALDASEEDADAQENTSSIEEPEFFDELPDTAGQGAENEYSDEGADSLEQEGEPEYFDEPVSSEDSTENTVQTLADSESEEFDESAASDNDVATSTGGDETQGAGEPIGEPIDDCQASEIKPVIDEVIDSSTVSTTGTAGDEKPEYSSEPVREESETKVDVAARSEDKGGFSRFDEPSGKEPEHFDEIGGGEKSGQFPEPQLESTPEEETLEGAFDAPEDSPLQDEGEPENDITVPDSKLENDSEDTSFGEPEVDDIIDDTGDMTQEVELEHEPENPDTPQDEDEEEPVFTNATDYSGEEEEEPEEVESTAEEPELEGAEGSDERIDCPDASEDGEDSAEDEVTVVAEDDFESGEENEIEGQEYEEEDFDEADDGEPVVASNSESEGDVQDEEERNEHFTSLESIFKKMEQDAKTLAQESLPSNEVNLPTDQLTHASGTHEDIRPRRNSGPYRIPEDLLTVYEENEYWIIDQETENAAKCLKDTLNEFKIEAEVTGIRKGPVVTMFEILPAPGVKLSRIVALSDNIALRLAASSVRIVAPIPGKRAVGIEVPNKNRAIVSFRECIEEPRGEWKKMAVPVVLGKDIQGETQIMDLVKTPHLLIAGSTGAGKSVCVNSMILSILYKRAPHEVKLILIDPKIVELKLYNGIPHLLTPVITEPKKAMQALQYCLCEMERRYSVLDGMGCRDIASYNRKIVEQRIAAEKLPYVVVIIDEFADLMATTGKALESVVARLAAMSRAVGIHLVLATQRPSVDVITGLIKANIPSRIAFMVAAKMDSRIIIDQVGAEKLLGKGDMLYASSTDPFPVRIQGAFVSDQEVENVAQAAKEWGEPEYIDDEIFVDDEDEGEQTELFGDGEDPLYEKALDAVIQAGKASASYVQRKLSIGYNRAARLIEEMEERGIVGPANGSKPREIIHVP